MAAFLQILGLVLVAVACGLWSVPLGVLAAGVGAVAVGVAIEGRDAR